MTNENPKKTIYEKGNLALINCFASIHRIFTGKCNQDFGKH
jgi:hypothetical protein